MKVFYFPISNSKVIINFVIYILLRLYFHTNYLILTWQILFCWHQGKGSMFCSAVNMMTFWCCCMEKCHVHCLLIPELSAFTFHQIVLSELNVITVILWQRQDYWRPRDGQRLYGVAPLNHCYICRTQICRDCLRMPLPQTYFFNMTLQSWTWWWKPAALIGKVGHVVCLV